MKSKLLIGLIIIVALGWWFWPRQSDSGLVNPQTAQEVPSDPPAPALPVIDQSTNLSEQLNKLTLPDPSLNYQRLDGLVNSL